MKKLSSLLKTKVTPVFDNGRDGTLYYYRRSLNGQLRESDIQQYIQEHNRSSHLNYPVPEGRKPLFKEALNHLQVKNE